MLQAQEHGIASYYSNSLHGRKMSDGTRYHKDSLTCAHKRYPLGTKLKVTNIKNGKSVVVKVTDRCGSRRVIDLSYAAAKQIGLLACGIATVKVERYFEFKCVPLKDDGEFGLSEFDYEVTEKPKYDMNDWLKTIDDKPITHKEKPVNTKTKPKEINKTPKSTHAKKNP